MSWIPTIVFALAFAGLILYGFFRAPYLMHKDVEAERNGLREELTRADRIEGVLVDLGRMRREGTTLRNTLVSQETLSVDDETKLDTWKKAVMDRIREISPPQAEQFGTLDLINITVPDYVARHKSLVFHSERLARLKDFIDRYDAMLMGSRGLGRREV